MLQVEESKQKRKQGGEAYLAVRVFKDVLGDAGKGLDNWTIDGGVDRNIEELCDKFTVIIIVIISSITRINWTCDLLLRFSLHFFNNLRLLQIIHLEAAILEKSLQITKSVSRRTVPPPSTVGSSLFLSIVFALVVTHIHRRDAPGFSPLEVSILLKKIAKSAFFCQSESPAIFASYHRWMKLKFGYVVLLSMINVLNGGDEKLTVQQGDILRFNSDLGRSNRWNTLKFEYVLYKGLFYILTVVLPKPDLFNGQNAIVAVNVHLGYNQADSLVMKRASLERGMFRSEYIRSYKAKVDNRELTDKRQKSEDSITFGKIQSKIGRVDSLNDDGFPFIGANMQSGDIVIGKCAESGTDHSLPPFEKPDHLKISGKPPQTRQSRRTVPPPSTVGSSLFLSIVFALVVTHIHRRDSPGFSPLEVSILLKKIAKSAFFCQSESPAIFASYHRWMKLKFGYVVLLSMINVLNGGDEKLTVQQGDIKPGYLFGHNAVLPKPDLFNGQNAIVAVNVHLGYNQADSLVMKRASLERGMFRSEHIRSYKAKVDNRELTDKRQKSEDSITFGKIQSKIGRVDSLNDDGFPFIGVNMQSGDIVIGKCAESGTDHSHLTGGIVIICRRLRNRSSEDFWKTPSNPSESPDSSSTVHRWIKLIFEYCVRLGCYYIFTEGILLSESPAIFASYHRWMKLKFGYVVLLSMINVLNGGDEKLTVQQGDMYVEQ
uniref:DNA-directed RNA polymerase n=2 Tax=Salix viminalis TaxID=40686 RepID=A0A6N2LP62_SALVM